MATCSYGIRKEGNSQFVIVAPHGARPSVDLYTGEISESIAEDLDAYLCVNHKVARLKTAS